MFKWQKTISYLICAGGPCGVLKSKIKQMIHNNDVNKIQLAALPLIVNHSDKVAAARWSGQLGVVCRAVLLKMTSLFLPFCFR